MASMFIALLLVAIASSASINQCPSNLPRDEYLQAFSDFCFRFHVNERRDYKVARETCEMEGGTLVMPKTQELDKFIKDTLKNNYKGYGQLWIGLTDIEAEKVFRWEDGSMLHPRDYDHWGINEGPGHTILAGQEDCVMMNPSDGYRWHDVSCSRRFLSPASRAFICQFNTTLNQGTSDAPTSSTTSSMGPTSKSTTQAVTTQALTTLQPTTQTPTNQAPTTQPPTTLPPTTQPPTTQPPTTLPPTTPAPTNPPTQGCPPFSCELDCQMDGYAIGLVTGCPICQCNT